MGPLERYRKPTDLPAHIPIFPLAGALLLPRTGLPLNIFEARYLAMVDDALSGERVIGMIQPAASDPESGDDDHPPVHDVGCAGRITSYCETADDRFHIVLTGICRFVVLGEIDSLAPYRLAEADYAPFARDLEPDWGAREVDRDAVVRTLRAYLEARQLTADWHEVEAASTEALVNSLCVMSPYPADDKQALLEACDLKSRAEMLIALTEMALARADGEANTRLQ